MIYLPIPETLTVEEDVFYLNGKEISEDHAEYIAEESGLLAEDDILRLTHLKNALIKRQTKKQHHA